jgi:rod shape-determining protein MreB and related proteins
MNLRSLVGLFSSGPYYVRISKTRLSLKDVSTGKTFETLAKLGLDAKNRVVAVGDMSDPGIVRVLEPFNHPRVVIADSLVASKLLIYGIREMSRAKWISPAPIVVIHPDTELEGGLSEIERRALLLLGEQAGARKTVVHEGSALSDQQVLALAA